MAATRTIRVLKSWGIWTLVPVRRSRVFWCSDICCAVDVYRGVLVENSRRSRCHGHEWRTATCLWRHATWRRATNPETDMLAAASRKNLK